MEGLLEISFSKLQELYFLTRISYPCCGFVHGSAGRPLRCRVVFLVAGHTKSVGTYVHMVLGNDDRYQSCCCLSVPTCRSHLVRVLCLHGHGAPTPKHGRPRASSHGGPRTRREEQQGLLLPRSPLLHGRL